MHACTLWSPEWILGESDGADCMMGQATKCKHMVFTAQMPAIKVHPLECLLSSGGQTKHCFPSSSILQPLCVLSVISAE